MYSRFSSNASWANDHSGFNSGVPPQLTFPRKVAPARPQAPSAASEAMVGSEVGVAEPWTDTAECQRWPGPGDFANSKVYREWRQVLREGQKLQDKCRAWNK